MFARKRMAEVVRRALYCCRRGRSSTRSGPAGNVDVMLAIIPDKSQPVIRLKFLFARRRCARRRRRRRRRQQRLELWSTHVCVHMYVRTLRSLLQNSMQVDQFRYRAILCGARAIIHAIVTNTVKNRPAQHAELLVAHS
ncbi:unnamed protein product [Strongylus vulgaris]|uniref:Uncharacterized protein n=1 Tax=Strongylus vulgaris TaxID=40348 RepID=A0A3P7IGI0_STRVU|nr:unnamed protein product [Strongylus vulgaris]